MMARLSRSSHDGAPSQAAADAIITFDASGRVLELNASAAALAGRTVAEAIGHSLAELFVTPDNTPDTHAILTGELATDSPLLHGRRVTLTATWAHGSTAPVDLVIARVPHADPPLFMGYLREHTPRSALEAERERLLQEQIAAREQLEAQAIQLQTQTTNLELASAELRDINARLLEAVQQTTDARRAAEAANEAKNEFLAVMSHELRTPLTAIIGYEELLADGITGSVSDAQREQLHRIKVSANHLLFLIDQVLTVARIDVGKEHMAMTRFPLRVAIDHARYMVEQKATVKRLRLVVHEPPDTLMIETDAGKVQQILVNLWSNAIEYTNEGSIQLDVQVAGGHVLISVADTGIGIAPEHLARIFDPFWQVERHSTRRHGGVGLGLNVTRRLARLLGGEVTVTSTVGKGSTFVVRLPLTPPPVKRRTRAAAAMR